MREESQTWGAVALRSSTCSSEPAKLEKKKRSIRRQHEKKKKKDEEWQSNCYECELGISTAEKETARKRGKQEKPGREPTKKKKERKELQIQCVELPRGKTFPVPNSLDTPLSKHTPWRTTSLTIIQKKNKNNNNRWVPTKKKKSYRYRLQLHKSTVCCSESKRPEGMEKKREREKRQ